MGALVAAYLANGGKVTQCKPGMAWQYGHASQRAGRRFAMWHIATAT